MQGHFDLVDPDPISFSFDCLRAVQPIGDIFLASIPFSIITKIAYFDVRRVIQEDRDVERYLGIQRPLDQKRVTELEQFVNFYDAAFPTAIIIAVDETFANYDSTSRQLTLSNVPKGETQPAIAISNLARVIDGQHRIAGLLEFKGEQFDVPVSIFVGADVADQAHIFSTVNLEQTKVNRSLVYDLYSLAKSRSPQKTCHNIVVALDQDEKSPFYKRIKRLGTTTVIGRFEPISQAGFVEMLLRYISPDPKSDRDALLRNHSLRKAREDEIWKYPFRNLFVDGKDIEIADAIFRYFNLVRERWPTAWDNKERNGTVLNRTNGFRALMRTYGFLYEKQGLVSNSINDDFVREHFRKCRVTDAQFNIEIFPPGSSGESRLVRVLTGAVDIDELIDPTV
ncbi:DGQHR domain-containing protein [Rhizobium leguminosarum]|nr:DGQHR domain-containing protein [Rhizobium leguminosarum]TAV56208.1 DGQHR domain-containing protein [Rhizobium leguminosarum]TAV81437.1 DGQHR domain-containing protein [Rhizobium leguminosarum]TAV96826.1 DGQHR domain-containing protein [Rhizobium leguminosarum]TAW37903.1 DGQHR domain-containing protein [Rhizobium leguminosarum]